MRIISVLVFSMVLLTGIANAQQTKTLQECLQLGLANNPYLRASQFKVDSAGYDIKTSRADFLPSVSTNYSASAIFDSSAKGATNTDYFDQNIRTFNIKLTQILYAGSRLVNTYQKAKILQQAAEADMHLVRFELAYNIETTFYKLMKAREDTISATEAVGRLQESVKSAEAFLQKELVPYVDVLTARVDLADAEDQLGLAKNNENRQREALFALMDLPPDPDLVFINGEYENVTDKPSFAASFQYAIDNRPDLKSLEYQFQAANKQQDIARGKYLPMVSLDVGYYHRNTDYTDLGQTTSGMSYDLDQTNRYEMASVTLSWNLFDGGKAYYEKEKYTVEAQKIRALIADTRNMISTGIRKALYSMAEAGQRLASAKDALEAAKENYSSEDKRLNAGISTIQALLDAQGRLIRAEGNKSNAVLDYQLAKSELKLMTGGE